MPATELQPLTISDHGESLAFISTFISRYSQGDKGKRMMGNSKINPQPNQIEEEKGKNRAHTLNTKRVGGDLGKSSSPITSPGRKLSPISQAHGRVKSALSDSDERFHSWHLNVCRKHSTLMVRRWGSTIKFFSAALGTVVP